jgi:16S rRNA (guanine527-N7)-methyltransferase
LAAESSCPHDLGEGQRRRLDALLARLATDPHAPTSIRDPGQGADVHVADSLAGLDVGPLRNANAIADLGSGAGFPGFVLAIALPKAHVSLVESVGRKADWLKETVTALGLSTVEVVETRAEAWRGGLERHDAVTARALASLPVLVEYAAPLLRQGGVLVAWKGKRDPVEDAAGAAAAERLGMVLAQVRPVTPYPGSRDRHLHVFEKVAPTPEGFPRAPGRARKRPIGVV